MQLKTCEDVTFTLAFGTECTKFLLYLGGYSKKGNNMHIGKSKHYIKGPPTDNTFQGLGRARGVQCCHCQDAGSGFGGQCKGGIHGIKPDMLKILTQ